MSQSLQRTNLNSGWEFKQTDSDQDSWYSVKNVPSVVHLDLIANQKIPDPFIGLNELDVEWVGEKSWTYRTSFATPALPAKSKAILAFDGLDTLATVKLNGSVILESSNMFLSHRVDITDKFSSAGQNDLEIEFASALLRGRELVEEHPEYRFIAHNGESGRLGVRKAQYHWGWDWGPVLMTAGPWRPVRLEIYESRIADLWTQIEVDESLKSASGTMFAKMEGTSAKEVRFSLKLRGDTVVTKSASVSSDGVAKVDILLDSPELWYPHGYGAQALYEVSAEISVDDVVLDTVVKKTGLRRAELIQDVDKIGKTFYFRVNNIDIFAAGSCWIPADNFIPRISEDKYRKWLQMMVDGRQVMTRVWGGGIYEEDVFYDLCDELGILVWQDFMFGCGSYPTWPALLDSIQEEAVCNVRRLRHHPSIVVYAGDNEDYQIQEEYNLEVNHSDKDPQSWLKSTYPARYISEHLLLKVVEAESPHIPYWPSSPWSPDGKGIFDKTVGDLHQWNVWHGTQEKYQIFDSLGGRFNSEFGMEAFPHIQTIQHFVKDPSQMYPQSHTIDFHNKADGHERRIATYLVENFRTTTNLEAYIHLTQLAQSEALMFAYRGWRRQWQDRKCGGALVWQLNDCWPVTSWAIVDYFLRKKPAYYAMYRVLAPIAVGVRRAHHDWSVCHARPAKKLAWDLWISSSEVKDVKVDVELRFVSIATGKDIKTPITKKGVSVAANGATDVLTGEIDNVNEEPHVLAARLWVNGELKSRDADWPQPLKYLQFNDRGLKVVPKGNKLHITAEKPVKGLTFEEREGVLVNDSAIDVLPGDEQIVTVRGIKDGGQPLSWRYLGQDE